VVLDLDASELLLQYFDRYNILVRFFSNFNSQNVVGTGRVLVDVCFWSSGANYKKAVFPASLALSSVSSNSCWALRNLARLRAAISSASSIWDL